MSNSYKVVLKAIYLRNLFDSKIAIWDIPVTLYFAFHVIPKCYVRARRGIVEFTKVPKVTGPGAPAVDVPYFVVWGPSTKSLQLKILFRYPSMIGSLNIRDMKGWWSWDWRCLFVCFWFFIFKFFLFVWNNFLDHFCFVFGWPANMH